MTTMNTAIRVAPNARQNPAVLDWSRRYRGRDNAAFLAGVARELERTARDYPDTVDPAGVLCVGLLGEFGYIGYGLRRAQATLRIDRQPSYWSHAFLVGTALSAAPNAYGSRRTAPWLYEVSFTPDRAVSAVAFRSGASPRSSADFVATRFRQLEPPAAPNIAIIALALTEDERERVLARAIRPEMESTRYDLGLLRARWFRYLVDPVAEANPLAEGVAMPSAAYVQLAYDAAGVDLSPGAMQRNTAPEHIWQLVRRLYRDAELIGADGKRAPRVVAGWYCVRDRSALPAPEGRDVAPERLDRCLNPAPPRRRRRR
jgi:hypothetical protein